MTPAHRSTIGGVRAVVTGAAGFIGSTLCESLVADGYEVVAIDALTDYYDPAVKARNWQAVRGAAGVVSHVVDLSVAALEPLLDGADVVYHLAGQPGVRGSWADGFGYYAVHNVVVTQRILEAARAARCGRVVMASSSSVYGTLLADRVDERAPVHPRSPYGVTKLACEHLGAAYAENFGLASVALRYFTVYGPRQRPDMATHRIIEAALDRHPFDMFGDGTQVRDFTYVDDVVRATRAAAAGELDGFAVFNVSGGATTSLNEVVEAVEQLVGAPVEVRHHPVQAGDVARTGGDSSAAQRILGWTPETPLAHGLSRQVAWHQARRAGESTSSTT